MEEQFLVEVLTDMFFTKEMLDKIEHLMQYLILFGFVEKAKALYKETFSYAKVTNKKV